MGCSPRSSFATAPFVVFSLTNFQLDLPLAAMAAVALYARTSARPARCVALGIVRGVGMLTKPTFATYVLRRCSGKNLRYTLPIIPAAALVVSFPPSPADWQEDRVLDDIVRASVGGPAAVAVVPNFTFFSAPTFATRHCDEAAAPGDACLDGAAAGDRFRGPEDRLVGTELHRRES